MSLQDAFCMIHPLQIQPAEKHHVQKHILVTGFPFCGVTVSLIQGNFHLPFDKYQRLTRIPSEQYICVFVNTASVSIALQIF